MTFPFDIYTVLSSFLQTGLKHQLKYFLRRHINCKQLSTIKHGILKFKKNYFLCLDLIHIQFRMVIIF